MNKKAMDILKLALEKIPRATQTMSKCYLMWPMGDYFPIFAESQDGCIVTSVDGEKFIDTVAALGPNFVSQNIVNKAIKKQLKKGINFSLPSTLELELAQMICDTVPCAEMVRFCKNGSDATTAAIRVARSYSGKDNILMAKGGYHGWGDNFCSVAERYFGVPAVLKEFIDTFEYNNIEDIENKLKTNKYAAVIMEPVSLEEPKAGYLKKVRELCTKYNTILIFDEMITCFRWSLGGAQEYFQVTPDITTMGKAIGTGMPLAFIAGKKNLMLEFENIFFSSTFSGETLSLAAGIATLKELKRNKDEIYKHVWYQGNRVKDNFNAKCKNLGICAAMIGMAPRMNIRFYDGGTELKDLFFQEMLKRKILVGSQFYITWATKAKHIDKIINATNESLEVLAHAVGEHNIDRYFEGQHAIQIFNRR
ncbi:MAG: aminotransferase class III-fold pyridoxal phosphate-dependent enzyme [Patescibacteria group bacterium]